MPDVPADLPKIISETLDEEIEDRLRDTRSVAELARTDQVGKGFDVPSEPEDMFRPVNDLPPL